MALHSWCNEKRVKTPPSKHNDHLSLFESLGTCQYSWSSSSQGLHPLPRLLWVGPYTAQRRCHSTSGYDKLSVLRRFGVTEMMEPCRWYLATWGTYLPDSMRIIPASLKHLKESSIEPPSCGFWGGHWEWAPSGRVSHGVVDASLCLRGNQFLYSNSLQSVSPLGLFLQLITGSCI